MKFPSDLIKQRAGISQQEIPALVCLAKHLDLVGEIPF